MTVSGLRRGPYRGKRLFDLVVLIVIALPAAVIGALCALLLLATSGRPALFRQERIGWRGKSFTVFKFRTMVNAPGGNPIFPDPSRITRAGVLLRRLSLDELPQLVNVAKGEMSIVGPRPTLAYQYARYDDRQRRRHDVRPGLTGLAQISGRNSISWAERIEFDLMYIERQSPLIDMKILIRSVGTVLSRAAIEGHPADDPLARLPD